MLLKLVYNNFLKKFASFKLTLIKGKDLGAKSNYNNNKKTIMSKSQRKADMEAQIG